jgi:hypothetical protein
MNKKTKGFDWADEDSAGDGPEKAGVANADVPGGRWRGTRDRQRTKGVIGG